MALDKNLQAIRILMRSVNFMYKISVNILRIIFQDIFFLIPHFYEIIKFLNIEL